MKKEFIIILILLFWAGFVSSISFMEAWVKFQAEGVSLPVGLSIGKKVFKMLNSVEWIFFFSYTILSLFWVQWKKNILGISGLLFLILSIQTYILLPCLTERALIIIGGGEVEKSMLHLYFGMLELIKVFGLVYLGSIYYRISVSIKT